MPRVRWVFAVLAVILGASAAPAQVFITRSSPYLGGFGVAGTSFNFSTRVGHGRLSFSASNVAIGYGLGYGGFPGYGFYPGFRQTTIIYAPPPLFAVQPIFVPVPVAAAPLNQEAIDLLPAGMLPLAQMRRNPFDPINAGERPPRGAPPERKAPVPEQRPQPRPQPQPQPPPRPMPPPPAPPAPEKDPSDENARLIALGKQAFALQEYGKAVQRFRQATKVAPNLPQGHFLLAQAQVALGKYHEAVDAIHAGMALQPDWPMTRFRPVELYAGNVGDYADHLRRLEIVVEAHPRDPVLLFLYAYLLWFDGRRDEARRLFQRALPGAAAPDVIQRFLRAPAAPAI